MAASTDGDGVVVGHGRNGQLLAQGIEVYAHGRGSASTTSYAVDRRCREQRSRFSVLHGPQDSVNLDP